MMHDVKFGYRCQSNPAIWNQLLHCRDKLKAVLQLKLTECVDAFVENDEQAQDVRTWMKVSHRHRVTRREAFNYLHHCYADAIDADQHNGDWTLRIHVYPSPMANSDASDVLLRIESGGLTENWFEWHAAPAGVFEFGLPADNVQDSAIRRDVWKMVFDMHPEGYILDVCTVATFMEYRVECV